MKKPKPLIQRLTPTLLKQLQQRKVTNSEAADKLGVSHTYLSRVVSALQKKEPGKTIAHRKAASEIYGTRRQFREKLAKAVLAGRKTTPEAAAEAQCSERTMFRYVASYRA